MKHTVYSNFTYWVLHGYSVVGVKISVIINPLGCAICNNLFVK